MTDTKNDDAVGEDDNNHKNNNDSTNKPRQWLIDRSTGKFDGDDSNEGEDDDDNNNSGTCCCWKRPPTKLCLVPPPILWFPGLLEQNSFCEKVGAFRCPCAQFAVDGDKDTKQRKWLMTIGLVANVLGFLFMVVACIGGVTTNNNIVKSVYFSNVELWINNIHLGSLYMSLNRMVFVQDGKEDLVIPTKDYCSASDVDGLLAKYYTRTVDITVERSDCQACANQYQFLMVTLIFTTFTYIPAIDNNILRFYKNYDINCQRLYGLITTLCALFGGVITWVGYTYACTGQLHFYVDFGDSMQEVAIRILPGTALVLGYCATCLKSIALCVHLALPTPSITRNQQLQLEYEEEKSKKKEIQPESDNTAAAAVSTNKHIEEGVAEN